MFESNQGNLNGGFFMKKFMAAFMALSLVLGLAACGNIADTADEPVIVREEESSEAEESQTQEQSGTDETELANESETEALSSALEVEETQTTIEEEVDLSELTEGELAARREQQENFAEARELLYDLENSIDKTDKINQMDKQILANNAYDFRGTVAVFIGDSITEGIASSVDQNGNFVSYVTYVNSYLHFAILMNHGVGGRMFGTYGGDELSLLANFDNVTNNSADVIVVFAGVNDYLTEVENKHFGSLYDKTTTGNFCGAVRHFMEKLKLYYGDKEIFFVTMYDINKTVDCEYADFDGQPTLGDYMEAEIALAEEYGFNVIDLYGTGFMDCSTEEASDYYLSDGLHPKDSGSIVLGEHIAAELSLYFGRKAD